MLFENNQIRLPTGDTQCNIFVDDFIEEATQYPFAKHDDTLSSLFHGINEIGKTFTYHIEMNGRLYDEYGELEKEELNNELENFWDRFSENDYNNKYLDKTEFVDYDKNGKPIKYFDD